MLEKIYEGGVRFPLHNGQYSRYPSLATTTITPTDTVIWIENKQLFSDEFGLLVWPIIATCLDLKLFWDFGPMAITSLYVESIYILAKVSIVRILD